MKNKKSLMAFIGISIAAFLGTLDSTIVNIALPTITNYFNSTVNDTSWISTIYVLAMSVFMITGSKLADQFGRKKLMLVGIFLFGISSALCSFSNSLAFLIAMRFIQGIGGAILTPIVLPMGIEIFGKEKRQMVIGSAGAIVAMAAASGPPLGGLLIQYINWRAVFFVNIPFCILCFILVMLFINESYDETVSKKVDFVGMLLLTISLFSLVFPLLKGRDYGWHSTIIIALFIVSAVSLILFIVVEYKSSDPMVELGLFKEITFTTSSICYMVVGFSIMCPLLIFNYFLQNVLEYSTLQAAFILMITSLTAMISVPTGSIIANKIGTRIVNFIGIVILGISIFLLSKVTVNSSRPEMAFDLFVCGIGLGFSTQTISSSIKYLPKEKSGIGSGIMNAFRQIGTCIGIAIMVSILNTNVSTAKDNIKSAAVVSINTQNGIITPVKNKLINIVNSSDGTLSENSIENQIKNVLSDNETLLLSNAKPTGNASLGKLYEGTGLLHAGTQEIYDGELNLNNGIASLSSGLGTLNAGSNTLASGFTTFNNGISQTSDGAAKLYSSVTSSKYGLGALSNGINNINNGAQNILSQFSPASNIQKPTLYDGMKHLSNSTQKASNGISSYTTAVDTTLFTIIKTEMKTDPTASATLLATYKNMLSSAEAAGKSADNSQVQMLANLVNIYSAATDPSITNVTEFEQKLTANSGNIVYSGNVIKNSSQVLSQGACQLDAQFQDGGSFKNGFVQLANGTNTLAKSTEGLNTLQSSIGTLSTSLSKLNEGAQNLSNGFSKIQNGISASQDGSDKLKDGSAKLVTGSSTLNDSTGKLVESIGMLGQKDQVQKVFNDIKTSKNEKIGDAFDKTFLIAAIVTMLASILGLFTDKKDNKQVAKSKNNKLVV